MGEKKVDFVKWFSELSNKDIPIAGGKGASLAEMFNAKVPVPPGFVVSAQSYSYFLEKTGISSKMKDILSGLDVNNTEKLNKASRDVREIIEKSALPKEMEEEITESYEILGAKKNENSAALDVLSESDEVFVAVRSSATTEDLADASFAGQQETFLNVRGKEELLLSVKKCMSSLFTPRAIFYREKKGFEHDKSYLAVVVQKMVNSKKSGVMFSQNPTSSEKSIVIEAVWGLGEGIVSGQIKPDHYEIERESEELNVTKMQISTKKTAIIKNQAGKNETITLGEDSKDKRVLDNYELKRLAQYALQLEKHYNKPQDIEFAIDESGIYIVQSRPITTKFVAAKSSVSGEVLLSGLGASPGVASGKVKIIHDLSELEKIAEGDVLVTEMTNPDMVVSMQKSSAIVTDEGGVTSHAAIVSREMGIPCVVGTGEATKKLKDGDIITVDGSSGKVFAGRGETKLAEVTPVVQTNTEIKVIIDLPEFAERAAKSKVRAVGLTRLEGIIAESGKHPLHFVKTKNMGAYSEIISKGLKKIAEPFEEVWVRTSDIRSDEYLNLEDAPKKVEGNPMLGDHGIRFSLKHREIVKAEVAAIKYAAEHAPNKIFGLMMPQVISVNELREIKSIAKEITVPKNMKIGIMVETPAAVMIIEELCREGISFISFGTNDLTQYMLAVDRNNEDVQGLYDETHPAVVRAIAHVIKVCKKHKVRTSICGQAGSRPDMVKKLIALGIDSISVNADAAKSISELVAKTEGEMKVQENKQVLSVEEVDEKKSADSFENLYDEDIESVVLKALDGEDNYRSGVAPSPNQDVPPLFDGQSQINGEDIEGAVSAILEDEVKNSLGREWKLSK